MSVCNWPSHKPYTADEARQAMRLWFMRGGFTAIQTNGLRQLTGLYSWLLDEWAQRMVLGGFGLRIPRGIELNDAGLALWNEVHPS